MMMREERGGKERGERGLIFLEGDFFVSATCSWACVCVCCVCVRACFRVTRGALCVCDL